MNKFLLLVHPFAVLVQIALVFAYFSEHINPALPVFFLVWSSVCTGIWQKEIREVLS